MLMSNSAFSVPTFGVVDTAFVKTSVKELPLCTPTILKLSAKIQDILPFCNHANLPPFVIVDEQNHFKGVAPLERIIKRMAPYHTEWLDSPIAECIDINWPSLAEDACVADTYGHLLQGDYPYLPILGGEHGQHTLGLLSTRSISVFLLESLADDIMEVYYPD